MKTFSLSLTLNRVSNSETNFQISFQLIQKKFIFNKKKRSLELIGKKTSDQKS